MRNTHAIRARSSLVGLLGSRIVAPRSLAAHLLRTARFASFSVQPAKGAIHVRFAVIFHRSCLAAVAGLLIAAPAALAADPVFTEFTGGLAPGFSANTKPDGIGPGPDGNVWM